jgi:hypothetical protein
MVETTEIVCQQETEKHPSSHFRSSFGHLPDHTQLPEEDGVFGAFDGSCTSASVELRVTIFCFRLRAWKSPVPSPSVK